MKRLAFVLFLLIPDLSMAANQDRELCAFPSAPAVLSSTSTGLLQRWDFRDSGILTSHHFRQSTALRKYRAAIRSGINTDYRFLLQRYLERGPAPDDAYNLGTAARSAQFKPISCLEALLLEFQIQRNPKMASDPTEFLATYLQRDGRLKVYYQTNDSIGISGLKKLTAWIAKDLTAGWKHIGNLHNHSFFMEALESKQPQGVLAPSATDMKLFKEFRKTLGLEEVAITNGFDTIHIPAREFDRYRSAE
jgi:hypothetical protein